MLSTNEGHNYGPRFAALLGVRTANQDPKSSERPHGSFPKLLFPNWGKFIPLLHSVVNNSCGFHPQWKVVALIFSAARLPRLLEEICWQFAAGLPAFSSLPFFSNSDPNLSAKLAPFSDPRQGPEKGSLSFFSRQCPNWGRVWGPNMGSRFGAQFWGPNLGPPSHAFLVAGLRATGLQ